MKTREQLNALESKYRDRFAAPYRLECFDAIPRPHPFCIGPKHVITASERFGGVLSDEVVRMHPCEMDGCNLNYDEHTSETVAFIRMPEKLAGHVPDALADMLRAIKAEAEADGIDGFAFLEPGRIHDRWAQ